MTTLKDCCRHVFEFVTQQKLHPGYRALDKPSNVFKHLQSSDTCLASCSIDSFEVLDSASTRYRPESSGQTNQYSHSRKSRGVPFHSYR